MGTGQMLITVGALILLGLVVLRVNNGFLNTGTVIMETKFNLLAVSLATSVIEEATGKAFDQNTDTSSVDDVDELSVCGPEAGEVFTSQYNDFDDYNGLDTLVTDMPSAAYRVECTVGYVDESNPNDIILSKRWHKRIEVMVTSESMTDTIRLSTIYSYFYFR